MTPEEFADRFPRLYHMADENAWPGIQRHGLLSTTALLDLFEISGKHRHALESCHRPASVPIEHRRHGRAIVRDQKPMSEGALRKCLVRMSPRRWYETLNGKVFFWLTAERLTRLLSARAYRKNAHCVLTIETLPLLRKHVDRITLSPINSGSTSINRSREEPTRSFRSTGIRSRSGHNDAVR